MTEDDADRRGAAEAEACEAAKAVAEAVVAWHSGQLENRALERIASAYRGGAGGPFIRKTLAHEQQRAR